MASKNEPARFYRLTAVESNDNEVTPGQTVHVSVSRTQAYFRVKNSNKESRIGKTKIIMNTPDEVFYVDEHPKEFREQLLNRKSEDGSVIMTTKRRYDDE